ncbi:MAG: LysR family transcriptional regulator, partial [Pseudomonadota bacterium]|nr:LysR family transcriptional regulator [Pseudomonadota bacterium]
MFDWNDLRHFLAVARSGSTLAAARVLKVSQPTVVRRIAALEEALGIALFERRTTGYVLTAGGEALLGKSEQVEQAATAVVEGAVAHARDTSGTVTISTFEIFGVTLIAPAVRE